MSCLIEVDNLRFSYPSGTVPIRGLSLHIKHGERVGLIGPNGAGKTSLFRILSGVMEAFEGSVVVGGCDLSMEKGRKAVHAALGIVFQNTDDQLFNPSVEEDIAFGPLNQGCPVDEVRKRVEEAMHDVGLDPSFRTRVPFHLSGGEKRRVAIAGVLAMKPRILLLDEPSSDLDPRGQRELVEILNRLEITRILSSHNLEFVRATCERVVVMDHGTIHADGPTEEVLSNHDLMEAHGLEVPISLRNVL